MEAITKIQEAARSATPEVRVCRRCEIGSVPAHQGDVYLHRVPDDHPRGEKLGTRQVAIGSTTGARHVVEGERVEVYAGAQYPDEFLEPEGCESRALLGPVVVAEEDFALTHPEHAHHRLPAGVYQVTYQYDARAHGAVQD